MTIYATRQYRGGATTVSEAHGGCGQPHAYEEGPGGWPQITCPAGCEGFLREQYGHSDNLAALPETYDEVLQREAVDRQGSRFRADLNTAALAKMAGMDGAAGILTAAMATAPAAPMTACPEGHPNPVTAKWCGQCGAPFASAGTLTCPGGHENPAGTRFCQECGQPIGDAAKPAARRRAATRMTAAASAKAGAAQS